MPSGGQMPYDWFHFHQLQDRSPLFLGCSFCSGFQFQNKYRKIRELSSLPLLVKGESNGSGTLMPPNLSVQQVNTSQNLKKTDTHLELELLLPLQHLFRLPCDCLRCCYLLCFFFLL